jgi:hypothetical protein
MIHPTDTPAVPPTAARFETRYEDTSTIEHIVAPARLTRWGAIAAGALTAMSAQVIFAVLGTAIGLTVIGAADDTPEQGLSIGAGIWWLVTGLVSLFVGGWVAGRLCGYVDSFMTSTHGFLSWCTVTVLSALMLAMASGSALGGSLGMVGAAMGANTRTSERPVNVDRSSGSSIDQDSRTVPSNAEVPQLTERERKGAAKNAAVASWWTLGALVLGATVATLGGRAGVREYEPPTGRRAVR